MQIVSLAQGHDKVVTSNHSFERLSRGTFPVHKRVPHYHRILNNLARSNPDAVAKHGASDARVGFDDDAVPEYGLPHIGAL